MALLSYSEELKNANFYAVFHKKEIKCCYLLTYLLYR